jgi:ParB-like chromosome segregation protein Spo0J
MIAGRPPKPPEVTRTLAIVVPAKITEGADFQRRRNGVDKAHVRTLAQAMRNAGGNLDPILLWQETGPDGMETGRLQLLDGAHRLAAHRSTRKGTQGIPAIIVKCSRDEALLLATSARSKDTLALSQNEKADAAWLLVRKLQTALSKAKIAKASGVSPRTVHTMRRRLEALMASQVTLTGEWWRDRKDDRTGPDSDNELSPSQRNAEISRIATAFRETAGMWPKRNRELVAEALEAAFGRHHRDMAEWLYGTEWDPVIDDGETGGDDATVYGLPITTQTGTHIGDPGDDF